MTDSVVGLGTLAELVYRDANGRDTTIKPRGKWLAWDPKRRELLICVMKGRTAAPLSAAVVKMHRKFHKADPMRVDAAEWPDPVGGLTALGVLVSLTYTIPKTLRSPGKDRYQWEHVFGDHGENGREIKCQNFSYPERYMPGFYRDIRGNFYIKRRRGNKYYVSDWLMW